MFKTVQKNQDQWDRNEQNQHNECMVKAFQTARMRMLICGFTVCILFLYFKIIIII